MDQPMGSGADPLLGATIAGRYRIVALIARGGMGRVYKAEQSALRRICALKVVTPGEQAEQDPEFFKRFSREASTAAKLTHPCSVTIFDYGRDEERNVYFIAMEYLDGRTLHRAIYDDGALPEARASKIAQQICRSLAEAHGLGLVHRDLKPGNVLLVRSGGEEDEHVKVLDFGLVKDLSAQGEDLTQTGTFMGSPKYTPPEQVMGGEVTARSDVYSLGVVLYEMLTGKVPFDRKVATATLMAHVSEAPPSMTEKNPDACISPAMEAIVMRCLEKSPDKRFGSMREVLAALKMAGGDAVDPADVARPSLPEGVVSPRASAPSLSITGSGPRAVIAAPPAEPPAAESLSPPQASSTLVSPPAARRRSLSVVGVALVAAVGGGAAALLLDGRGGQAGSAGTARIESVVVPIAVPAGTSAVTPSPSQGLRLVQVESDPPGARVSDRGTEVCMATPCRIVLQGEAEYRLTLVRAGYKTAELVVGPRDDKAIVQLEPAGGDLRIAAAGAPEGAAEAGPPEEGSASEPKGSSVGAAAATAAAAEVATAAATPEPAAAAPEPAAAAPEPAAPARAAAAPAVMHFQDGMSRPTPISAPAPVYTREALAARVQGSVIAKCVVTTAGTLTGCRIVKGVPHMNEAVLSALAASRYRPVTYQGKPVNVDYVFTMKLVPP